MRRINKFFVLFVIAFNFAIIHSKIIESNNFSDILSHAKTKNFSDEETIVLIDLDGTITLPNQILGSDTWAYYEGGKFIEKKGNAIEGLHDFWPTWEMVQNNIDLKLVDDSIPDVLKELKRRRIPVVGFTARGPGLKKRTREQLDKVNVSWKDNSYHDKDIEHPTFHFDGETVFVEVGLDKGESMLDFFDTIGKWPGKVVFVDDRSKNIKSVEKACRVAGIKFLGIRYGGGDYMIKNFVPILGDIQLYCLKHLNKVLSDEEAKDMLDFFKSALKEK